MREQEAEFRKHEILSIQEEELKKKRKQLEDREKHRLEVLRQNQEMEEEEKKRILKKIDNDEKKLDNALQERRAYLKDKKKYEKQKREERERNVKKIVKEQEKEREMILKRIEEDNSKAEQIKREKQQLQEIRKGMRIEADLMRSEMMEYFTKIQTNKGSLEEANKMLDEFSKKFESKHAQLMAMANSDNANSAVPYHTSPKFNSSEKKLK